MAGRTAIAAVFLTLLFVPSALAAQTEAIERDLLILYPGAGHFPAEARRSGRSGTSLLEVEADTGGRVTRCDIALSSGHRELDEAGCTLLLAGEHFLPVEEGAPDASGRRRLGMRWTDQSERHMYFGGALAVNMHRWFRPEDYPHAGLYYRMRGRSYIAFDVTPEGGVENCRPVRSSGYRQLDAQTCWLYERRARFLPPRDSAGKVRPANARTHLNWGIIED